MVNLIQNSPAPVFTGEFPHKVEGKNRLTIPADWRFGEEVELFLTPRTNKKCIGVFTRAEVDRLRTVATEKMSPADRANFLDKFGRKMRRVVMDKAGRISLPEDLRTAFHIEKDVMFSGAVDTFNIWNPADFKSEMARNGGDDDVMAQLGI
jgi:MraZ protein